MRIAHDETLRLRLPASLRRDLDAAARAGGVRLSVATRTALSVGLAAIRSTDSDRDPPTSPGASAMQRAA
ncbi:hypothetical protein [Methylobacterium sp. J-067]|uniref:hypothetical protein n=1 Tax=Methylobacterium sp. J-067 TaxID=2836648 RepID=UPI001FBB66C4|nr:hypothetical protein [Methylobacterium sp. J-067]MCJ2025172.1 hypothetical protein [Methylobacterium sp. J-067]